MAFARVITGTLSPASLLDRLVSEIKASFGPAEVLAVTVDEQGHRESANGDPEHPVLAPALAEVLRSGAPRTGAAGDAWVLGAPLTGRRSVIGAVTIRLPIPPTESDRALLEGLTVIAAVALEGARLAGAADLGRKRWEEAVDSAGLALCLLDRSGRVERMNRGFSILARAEAFAAVGRHWTTVLPEAWQPAVSTALLSAEPAPAELRHGERTLAVTAYRDTAADSGRTVLLFEDQTDRRRLQDRLIQSEKLSAIGQLIAGVAHDLNNPLTSVVGFADFLAESAEVPPRIREPLRVVQQEAERASKIVKNLLSFARRQESRQSASLRPILEATVGLFRNQLSVEEVTLTLELAPELPDLDLNPNQIQQVFVNLIQNAAQAIASAGRPGSIRVSARRWMDGVAIDIADDGPGMSAEVAAQVFEPFFTTKPEGQGTGLGLSICQGIAREHGGRITLATRPGEGSVFTIELPGRVRPAAPPVPTPVPAAPRALRVLVVDDEPHILHYIRATLEAWGHEVVTAGDGQVALDHAVNESFDLIISDLRMPRLGGREFFEALTRQAPQAAKRVAFSTGDTVRGDTLDFLETSGRPCLQKPFSLAELRVLLREAGS